MCPYRFIFVRLFGSHDPEQVLLHLLRAGYAALASGGDADAALQYCIRTVYFKHPDAFPEIDAFTLETPSLWVIAFSGNMEMHVEQQFLWW